MSSQAVKLWEDHAPRIKLDGFRATFVVQIIHSQGRHDPGVRRIELQNLFELLNGLVLPALGIIQLPEVKEKFGVLRLLA